MTSISKSDRLLQVLRAAAPAARGQVGGRRPPTRREPGGAASPRFDLSTDVVRRIAAIPVDAPEREELVVRAFLEGCVAQAFGSAAVSDPGFQAMISRTRETIRESVELSAAMARLVHQLAGAA